MWNESLAAWPITELSNVFPAKELVPLQDVERYIAAAARKLSESVPLAFQRTAP